MGSGNGLAPDSTALSRWCNSSLSIWLKISALRLSCTGSLPRWLCKCSLTWVSVSATNPKLNSSEINPATAPMPNDSPYQSGLKILGWLPNSFNRVSHHTKWSISSSADWCMAFLTVACLAVNAWPWYSPCAHTSPVWLIRMRPATWRASSTESFGTSGLETGNGRVLRLLFGINERIARSKKTILRSSLLSDRLFCAGSIDIGALFKMFLIAIMRRIWR